MMQRGVNRYPMHGIQDGMAGRPPVCQPWLTGYVRGGGYIPAGTSGAARPLGPGWRTAVGRLRMASRCAPAGGPLVGKVLAEILAMAGQVAGAGCVRGATRGSGHGRPGRWST